MRIAVLATGLLSLSLFGCGGDDAKGSGAAETRKDGGPGETPDEHDAAVSGDATPPAPAGDYRTLHAYDWTIGPGVEAYYCDYETLKEDLLITDFRPLMPSGTHHVVVGYQDPVNEDGHFDEGEGSPACTGTSFGDVYTFVATVGTGELSMPDGVAVRIPKGKQVVYGFHVFNGGGESLSGRSGVEIKTAEPSAVKDEAEVFAIDNLALNIPPGTSTQSSVCTMTDDVTLFAVLPHMHLTGVHIKTTADLANGETGMLIDSDYEFTEQRYTMLPSPMAMRKGAKAHQTCTYENPGPNTLTFGENTEGGEMCITFAYRYPAVALNTAPDTSFGFPLARSNCVR